VAAAVLWYVVPFIDTRPPQDNCSFGSISNVEYRGMLREAKEFARNSTPLSAIWKPAKNSPDEKTMGGVFAERLRQMILKQKTRDAQFAALHAVMRASGALYGGTGYVDKKDLRTFAYYFDVNRAGKFAPFARWAYLRVWVFGSSAQLPIRNVSLISRDIDEHSGTYVTALIPSIIEPGSWKSYPHFISSKCPVY
jgi:hypothetical protein